MKKFLLMIGLISLGQIINIEGSDRDSYNDSSSSLGVAAPTSSSLDRNLVSIIFPQLKANLSFGSQHVPYFQIPLYMERVITNIHDSIDDKGRVELKTKINNETVKKYLEAYVDKDISTMSAIKQTLNSNELIDFSNNVCQPLGIPLLCDLPSFYDKQVGIAQALKGKDKNDFVSLIVGTNAGQVRWAQRHGSIILEKQKIQSIIPVIPSSNIIEIQLNKSVSPEHAESLAMLIGAYINACADTNPIIKTQNLKQICAQVPATLVDNFKNNISRLCGIGVKDIIGFEGNIIHTGAKSIWNTMHNFFAIGGGIGAIILVYMGINRLRS